MRIVYVYTSHTAQRHILVIPHVTSSVLQLSTVVHFFPSLYNFWGEDVRVIGWILRIILKASNRICLNMTISTFAGLRLSAKRLAMLFSPRCFWSRTMVKKFRWQEIRRKIWSPSEPPAARLFSEPQWQEHVSLVYFLYRWLIFGLWSAFIVCSIFEIGSRHPVGKREIWPIYLTHWDLVLGAGHTFLGAILVTRRRSLQRFAGFEPDSLTLGKTEHAYWILYTLTCSIAIGVTILYWGAIYNPKVHFKDPLNYIMHLFNTVLTLSDLMVVGVPLRVEHFWWPLACVSLYLIFTLFYYLAGGLDKNGYHYIYKILDWEQPGRTLLVCLGGLLFLAVVHCTLCSFVWLRRYIRAKATGAIMTTTNMTQSSNNKTGTVGLELPL